MEKRTTRRLDGKKCPLFVFNYDVLRDILNGQAMTNRMFQKMIDMKNDGMPFQAITTQACLLRAIHLANPHMTLQNLKLIIELVKVYSSSVNYKKEREVIKEITKFADLMSRGDL